MRPNIVKTLSVFECCGPVSLEFGIKVKFVSFCFKSAIDEITL